MTMIVFITLKIVVRFVAQSKSDVTPYYRSRSKGFSE